ncbi:hypothetical protein ACFTXJ_21585 [Streptomyces zhihengii]|uniref:hypothetical protein n=1 Tax=Streptomyces zhihengii TaxID=1818004 RepID=UPI003642ED5D
MTDARSPLRALRAALFAAVAVLLAAMGHSSLSAHDIPPSALFAALGVTAAAGWAAAGRRRGPWSIGTGLLAVQGALHLLFAAPARPGTAHHHTPHPAFGTAPVQDTAAYDAPVQALGSDTGMIAVHLLAAAACALWLAHGESAFFRLARTVLAFAFTPLRLLLATVTPPGPACPGPAPVRAEPRRPHHVVLAHTVVRRGPPVRPVPRATAPGATV